MQRDYFYYFGRILYLLRWPILLLGFVLILCSIPILPHVIPQFKTTGFVDQNSQSAKTENYLNQNLGYSNNRFIILYQSKNLLATNPAYIDEIKRSLVKLKSFPIKYEIIYPNANKKQIAADKHISYAIILFKSNQPITNALLAQFKSSITVPKNMTVLIGGEPIFVEGVHNQTKTDLFKADLVATPVSIITLIVVFGSLIATILPITLGGGCALLILCCLYFLSQMYNLSIFTLNIALLLGLCLSLDYSLFIVSRFRFELDRGVSVREAISVMQSTAGKAVFFSGLAVFASLSALLLFPINILFSVGVGGLTAVSVAVVVALILLPAALSIIGKGINFGPIPFLHSSTKEQFHFWRWLVSKVVKRPTIYFITIITLLLALGYPFLSVQFGVSTFRILPEKAEARQFFNMYTDKFGENQLTPILMVIKTAETNILSQKNISQLYDFTHRLKNDPDIDQVNSIVTTQPSLTKKQYHALYATPKNLLNTDSKKLLAMTTLPQMTVVTIISKYPSNSSKTKELITRLRKLDPGKNFSLQLTGSPVDIVDVLSKIRQVFMYALIWIMVFTYLILLILLRSLFLPLKAIAMNILSLCASYGVLVFIIQEGYLHQFLNFEPQGILDSSLVIIIFCALFGFSMDYEVFLLTRIKEHYDKTKNNNRSIIYGIEHSSRIITSAAIIVILICCSFMVADVLMVKAFGLGIAIAIFVDAFLIRTILVPATMALIQQWNWYIPRWLDKIIPKL